MNRSTRYLLACCLLLGAIPMLAAKPLQEGAQGIIRSPQPNEAVRGNVVITVSANIASFQFYKIEWARSGTNEWHLIGSTYPTPVTDGVLLQWDTTTVPDGAYVLRLQVVKLDGNYQEYYVQPIIVANKRPTETATPKPVETRAATATPGPTATLAILQPTAALAQPSPTPTPVRLSPRSAMPQLPLTIWREAFCLGVGTMAAIFAVLGMVFALKRIL